MGEQKARHTRARAHTHTRTHTHTHTEGSQRVCPLLMFVSKWKFPRASRKTLGSSDLGEVIGSALMVS